MTAARATKPATPISLDELIARDGDVTKHLGDRPLLWHVDMRAERPDVLALDLAAEGGWFFLGRERREPGIVNAEDSRIESEWCRAIAVIVDRATNHASIARTKLLVVVEDTNLGSAANTPYAFAAITRYGAAVATIAAQRRLAMIRVPASTWQSRVLGKIRRDQGKALSLAVARQRFGAAITTNNVSDAALLALYVRGAR